MKKIETLFIGAALMAGVVVIGARLWRFPGNAGDDAMRAPIPTTQYGAFLAAQHAIYVNDFDTAARLAGELTDTQYASVQNTKYITEFLSGRMPADAKLLENEKSTPAQLIYDAYLVTGDAWDALYKRHKKDTSALAAPLRIWASVATGRDDDAMKFIDGLSTNASWKAFVRGQIHAVRGNTDAAAKAFSGVDADFMNINDYLYLMSFYRAHDMDAAADKLRGDFTARVGGMFMLDYDTVPAWSRYDGLRNALAFSLVQNVSHTQIMMYSDLAILLLRFAQITGPDFGNDTDTINYYLGQFFFNNNGAYQKYFDAIDAASPFKPFVVLRAAEKSGDMRDLRAAADKNPLFVPAVNKLVAYDVRRGARRDALRTVNHALGHKNLTEAGRAFFLKSRAHIHYVFGDLDAAQQDLHAAADVLPIDGEILGLQAKIWARQNRDIDNAYDYAMALVKQNPADVAAWDTLGRVVATREGGAAALEILERVGEVSQTCSSLFEQLGDLYAADGQARRARDAYNRAIDLSDDGLVVVPQIQKKLRILK